MIHLNTLMVSAHFGRRRTGRNMQATGSLMKLALAAALLMVACGGGGGTSTPSTPTPTPMPMPTPTPTPTSTTFTITSSGVSPRTMTISPGARVLFVNNDSRPHDMSSDPHPAHTDCPAINQAGFLPPGQSRESGNLTTVRTCGFHDHDQSENASLKGTITIR